MTDVARRCGVIRQTVYTWLRRYASEGLAGFAQAWSVAEVLRMMRG